MSKTTNNNKIGYIVFSILSFAATFAPIIAYVIKGYCEADLTTEKVRLTCTVLIAIVLTVVNIICKFNIRSTIWILLLGVYFCVEKIMPLILILAFGTILDEFVFTPFKKKFKEKYTINKELDKRL